MDWRLKALAFRVLDLPGGTYAHYFLQRHVTRNWPRPATTLTSLESIARRVIDDYARHLGGTPSSVLEIGAGRDLAVPLALRKLGVAEVITSDVDRLARLDLIQHAAAQIFAGEVKLGSWNLLERFGICHRRRIISPMPTEGRLLLLERGARARASGSTGAVAGRTARGTTGITTHSIDYSDHYARSDGSLSRFNFLKYYDAQWRPFNSGRQYVNRLRHSDYVRMFREAGFTILEESSVPGEPGGRDRQQRRAAIPEV